MPHLNRSTNMMYPIFFNPMNNQLSYSFQASNHTEQTFIPIATESLQKNFLPKQISQNTMGNLTLNAQKLNQDLHNQNVRNIRMKENGVFWSMNNQKNVMHQPTAFKLIGQRRSEEANVKKENELSPVDDCSFETKNQQTKNIKIKESNSNEETSKYLNIQINVEFDQENIDLAKRAFKFAINENLKAIQTSLRDVNNIKILFTDSITSTPKFNSEMKSEQNHCNSISLISTSENFDLEAQQTIEENLSNVVKNSLLFDSHKSDHKKILFQTNKIVFQILNSINFSNSISFEKNFFRLFNLQVPIDSKLFKNLNCGSKVKIFCYLFCKYFRKNIISLLYESFYEEVNIPEICSDNRSKSTTTSKKYFLDVSEEPLRGDPQEGLPPVLGKVDLSSIFPDSKNEVFDWLLIRKLLILLLHQLRLFNDYLRIKLGSVSPFESCRSTVQKLRHCLDNQMMTEEQFAIDSSLLGLNLAQLVDRISIWDLQLFVALSNVDFLPKRTSKIVCFMNRQKEMKEFEMTIFERDSLLIPKVKRKDEKIKFVFKSIRKQLFNEFKLKSKNNHSVEKTKRLFNNKYLHGKEDAIKYFYSNDLSKKKLKVLNECSRLIHNMKSYKSEKYIKDQVEISIYRKSEDFLNNKKLNLADFKKILFDRQSKHTWILQDILNSIPAFETFFVFPRNRKRIKKKRCVLKKKINNKIIS